MPSHNDITGDAQQTRHSEKIYKKLEENGELMSICDRRKNRGSWVWDSDLKKLVPKSEWQARQPVKEKGPIVFVDKFEPFVSMVTDKLITNRKEHDYDLKSTNSRVYEGREQEQKEADRYKAEKEEKLWANVSETMNQTMHEIEHGYRNPPGS